MRRTSLPVKLQHDAGTFWGIIIFTRNCKMQSVEHDVVQKVKKVRQRSTSKLSRDFDVLNISVKLWNDTGNSCRVIVFTKYLDLELVLKFKKVTQRSTSNSSVILMGENYYQVITWYRQFMKSYHVHKVLPDAACLKVYKGNTKVRIKLGWNSNE